MLALSTAIGSAEARDPLSGEVSTPASTITLLKKPPSIGLGENGMVDDERTVQQSGLRTLFQAKPFD